MQNHSSLGTAVPVDEAIDKSDNDATNSATDKPKSKWAHLSADVEFFDGGASTSIRMPEIRRPFDQRHFRIHQTFEIPHLPIIIDQNDYGQVYVLSKDLVKQLPVGDRKYATIYGAVSSDDVVYFHFRKESANEASVWSKTANNIIDMGRASWIRTTTMPGGGYEIHTPTDPEFQAKVPAWPADIDEAFGIALNGISGKGGQLISSPDHRVIVNLLHSKR